MILLHSIDKLVLLKKINREGTPDYFVLPPVKQKDYFMNRFRFKTNWVLSYKYTIHWWLSSKSNYYKERITTENKYKRRQILRRVVDIEQVYRKEIDDGNFILLGNHGYNKQLDLLIGFDYYIPHTGEVNFYFQFIVTDEKSELAFAIRKFDFEEEDRKMKSPDSIIILEPFSDFTQLLLYGINSANDNFLNIKNYFTNYKKLINNIIREYSIEEEYNVYLYNPLQYKLRGEYNMYRQVPCVSRDRKVNINYYVNYYREYDYLNLLRFNHYTLITKHRFFTSFVKLNGLEVEYLLSYDHLVTPLFDFSDSYLLYGKDEIILFDNADSFRKLSKSYYGKDVEAREFSYSQFMKEYLKDNTTKDFLLSINEHINPKIVTDLDHGNSNEWIRAFLLEWDDINNSNPSKKYHLYLACYKDLDLKFYDNEKNIYTRFDTVCLYTEVINSPAKIYVQAYLANKNYIFEIDTNFLPILFGDVLFENFINAYRPSIKWHDLEKINFARAFMVSISLGDLQIKIRELPQLSNNLIEIKHGNDVYYVFKVMLMYGNADTPQKYKFDKKYIMEGHYEVENSKKKKIRVTFDKLDDNDLEGGSILRAVLIRMNYYMKVGVYFYINKELWAKIKCDNSYIEEIRGKFYVVIKRWKGGKDIVSLVCVPISQQERNDYYIKTGNGYYNIL